MINVIGLDILNFILDKQSVVKDDLNNRYEESQIDILNQK